MQTRARYLPSLGFDFFSAKFRELIIYIYMFNEVEVLNSAREEQMKILISVVLKN